MASLLLMHISSSVAATLGTPAKGTVLRGGSRVVSHNSALRSVKGLATKLLPVGSRAMALKPRAFSSKPDLPLPTDVSIDSNPGPSRFLHPKRMRFQQGGRDRAWDLIESHDAVCVLVHHVEKDAIILVRQFRPAVYYRDVIKNTDDTNKKSSEYAGFTLEMPAGLVDKTGKSRVQIAAEEVYEETGYRVDAKDLTLINSYRSSVGLIGSLHDVYYVQVKENLREGRGGGLAEDGENIEVVYLSTEDVDDFLRNSDKVVPAGLLFGLQWFQYAKATHKLPPSSEQPRAKL